MLEIIIQIFFFIKLNKIYIKMQFVYISQKLFNKIIHMQNHLNKIKLT